MLRLCHGKKSICTGTWFAFEKDREAPRCQVGTVGGQEEQEEKVGPHRANRRRGIFYMSGNETAVFGGGCFWCTEAVFLSLKGIISAVPGYAGGTVKNPTYEQVCAGNTGHVECIKIEFDPAIISFDDLLAVFFSTHDPTTIDRQGNDVGNQYNSVIFYTIEPQRIKARTLIKELNEKQAYDSPVVTAVKPLTEFYPAEDYHREYYKHHSNAPYCQAVVVPKLEKLRQRFATLVKEKSNAIY